MVTMILDGYNVIHAMPELARHLDRSLQAAREALVRLCQDYRARRGDLGRCYVVFDGRETEAYGSPEQQQHGGVTVLFAQHPEEADARMLRVIDAQGSRSRCVVVSNDNEVFNNARAFGARVISVQAFCEQVRAARTSRPALHDAEDKPMPRDARQITEDYRTHLEKKLRA